MKTDIPIVADLFSASEICNKKGFRFYKENRESSVLIIVLEGKIRFSSGESIYIATPDAPIYIPSGTTYLNECVETAESIMFNFVEAGEGSAMRLLSKIEGKTARRTLERISLLKARNHPSAKAEILSLLYNILSIGYSERTTKERTLIEPAINYIELHLHDPELTVSRLAELCCISTVYLGRIFKGELLETPFSYLTRRRMEIAMDMLKEHCSVGEIVRRVGYSDIYQFSRAFKKYYGVSPKNYESKNFNA